MNLREKIAKGLAWSFVAQGGRQVSQFVVTVILARLLDSRDFGLLGMATFFVGLMTVVSERGLSDALIQNQKTGEAHYSSAFWINVVLGAFFMMLLMSSSAWIAGFYRTPELQSILVCLSLNFAIGSFSVVQRALLMKEMNFRTLAVVETWSVLLGGAAGIYFAYHGWGVWSLVFQSIGFNLANTALLWLLSRWKPKLLFSWAAVKEMFNFSASVSASFILNHVSRNIDYLLIGKFLGAEPLGYYTLAYRLMLYPLRNIAWVIGKVMFPAFSRLQQDFERVRRAYIKVTKVISLVIFPLLCGLLAVAPEFVEVVFGVKWRPAVGLIQILCVCGMVQTISASLGSVILSQGRSDLRLKFGAAETLLAVLAIMIGLRWGVYGVAVAYTLQQILWVPVTLQKVNLIIALKFGRFIRPIGKIFLMSVAMMAAVFLIKWLIKPEGLLDLLVMIATGVAVYLALLIRFEWDFIKGEVFDKVYPF